MKPLLASLPLLLAPLPSLGQRSVSADHTCYAREGRVTQRECLTDRAKESEQRLEYTERAVRDAIRRADQERDEVDRALAAFEKTVSGFRRYRKEQCEFVAMLAFGGNAQGDRRLLCEIDLNMSRIQYLSSDSKDAV
jgi:uncharacterized protein YecT (DUF1311 family)